MPKSVISVLAHRGWSENARENTLGAFLEACRRGADGVELDVRRSADGALVVHHDAALPDGRQIVNLQVGDLPDWVPLLDAALDACAGSLVDVEVKNLPGDPDHDPTEAVPGAVAGLVVERRLEARTVVSSFSLASIDASRGAEPGVPTALLTLARFDQHRALDQAAERGHAGVHPQHNAIDAALVDAAHRSGLAVRAWTVNEPDRMRALADMGVDAVITDALDLALDTLAPWRD